MHVKQIIGIVLVVLGISLITLSYRASETTSYKIKKHFFSGEKKNNNRELIGGIVLVVAGAGVFFLGRKKGKKR